MRTYLIILGYLALFSFVEGKEFRVDSSQPNSVKFFAKATFGGFNGTTDQITGYLRWQGNDTLATGKVYFEVDLDSIDTGIGKRNKHMREKYLETDRYPKAIYEGKLLQWFSDSDSTFLVKTSGTLSIHGIDKPFSTVAKMIKKGEMYQIYLNFNLDIKDFNISKPRFLLVSMDEAVALQLSFFVK